MTPTGHPAPAAAWFRDVGATSAVRELLPGVADPLLYAVTQTGDPWLLVVALALFYWYGPDRRRAALALAVGVGGLALVAGLKALFALPRPPGTLAAYAADGYGFPSGHALGSTVVWGGLALLGEGLSTRRRRLAAAGVLVALASLSRLALGVHYLGDVVAGALVGAAFLLGALRVADGVPERAFALGGLLAVGAVAAGALADGAAAAGAAAGGGVAWYVLDPEGPVHPAVALAGVVGFGGLWAAVTLGTAPWQAVLLGNAVAVGGLVAVPALQRRVAD